MKKILTLILATSAVVAFADGSSMAPSMSASDGSGIYGGLGGRSIPPCSVPTKRAGVGRRTSPLLCRFDPGQR